MKSLTFQRLREVNKTAKMHSEIARANKIYRTQYTTIDINETNRGLGLAPQHYA
jgi:hypothetical protein